MPDRKSPAVEATDVIAQFGHLPTRFARRRSLVTAVDKVSLTVQSGTTVGLVGESGSGKTTFGRILVRLLRPTSGTVIINGVDLAPLEGRKLRRLRRHVQMVSQDPFSSLNPMMTVRQTVEEPLRLHTDMSSDERIECVDEMLISVGLTPGVASKYPVQLSGGQRQRIAIARAFVTKPLFVVCDEIVSALDVSTQGQVLELLHKLQNETGVALLFISHDLSVVRLLADEIAVMHTGKLVEVGPTRHVLESPEDPYTRELLSSIPGQRFRTWGTLSTPSSKSDSPTPRANGGIVAGDAPDRAVIARTPTTQE